MRSTTSAGADPWTASRAWSSFAPLACLGAVLAAELLAILIMNDGQFVYSLDDPYIHLSVAESLVHGGYGVNPGEFSTPSSSILWPFLLAPFQLTPLASYAPLLINILAAAATVLFVQRIVRDMFAAQTARAGWGVAAASVVFTLSGNVVALVFTGMEHSLQLLSVVAILNGALFERKHGRLPAYCLVALTAAPWLRYESAVVSAAFGAYFWARGHRREVLICGAMSLCVVLAFSAFLWATAGVLLPGSVVVKAVPVAPDLVGMLRSHLLTVARTVVEEPQALLLCVLALGFSICSVALAERALRWLAAALLAACVGHLLIGKFGAFDRYESYIWLLALLGLAWLLAEPARRSLSQKVALRVGVLGAAASCCAPRRSWRRRSRHRSPRATSTGSSCRCIASPPRSTVSPSPSTTWAR